MRTERPASSPGGRSGLSAGTTTLLLSARDWLASALEAWADEDASAVSTYAPLAVEELSQAVLWQLAPVLTVPLDPAFEVDFLQQATRPELEASRPRMVDLAHCLARLEKLLDQPFPLAPADAEQVVACRVSTLRALEDDFGTATDVLTSCLRLSNWLLDALRCPHGVFYGDRSADVADLLDDQRSELEQQVARKMTQARSRVGRLREVSGSQERFVESGRAMAEAAQSGYGRATDGGADGRAEIAFVTTCPVCEFGGVTLGLADADAGEAAEVRVAPHAFVCGVCKLRITGPGELAASPIPSEPRSVRTDELAGLHAGARPRVLSARTTTARGEHGQHTGPSCRFVRQRDDRLTVRSPAGAPAGDRVGA